MKAASALNDTRKIKSNSAVISEVIPVYCSVRSLILVKNYTFPWYWQHIIKIIGTVSCTTPGSQLEELGFEGKILFSVITIGSILVWLHSFIILKIWKKSYIVSTFVLYLLLCFAILVMDFIMLCIWSIFSLAWKWKSMLFISLNFSLNN